MAVPLRDAEDLRHVAVRVATEVGELDGLALTVGQGGQRLADLPVLEARLDLVGHNVEAAHLVAAGGLVVAVAGRLLGADPVHPLDGAPSW